LPHTMQCLALLVKRVERSYVFVAAREFIPTAPADVTGTGSGPRHPFPLLETRGDSWHAVCHGKQRPTRTRSKKAQEKDSEARSYEPLYTPHRDAKGVNTACSPKESARLSISREPRELTESLYGRACLPSLAREISARGTSKGPPPFVSPFFPTCSSDFRLAVQRKK
jgi:hypothetical protein